MEDSTISKDLVKRNKIPRELWFQIIVISIMNVGTSIFFNFEGSIFNSYVRNVLGLKYLFVAIMVSLSATMGLIFWFVFGIKSDNTRTKYGRRRPYMLLGPIAGVSMILFAYAPSFIWVLILDCVIIGIFANAHLAAEESVLPDVVESKYRGRANSIKGLLMTAGSLVPYVLLLWIYDAYTMPDPSDPTGKVITQEGHALLLLIGGLVFICTCLIGFTFIREPLGADELPPVRNFMEDLKEIFEIEGVRENKQFFRFLIAFFIFSIGSKMAGIFSFFYILELGLETWLLILAVGTILPLAVILGIAGGFLADKRGRKYLIIPFVVIACIGYALFPFGGTGRNLNLSIVVLSLVLVIIGTAIIGAPLEAWKQDLLPEDKRGQYLGVMNITATLNQIPAVFIGAIVADTYGVEWVLIFVPIFFLGSLPIFMSVKETLKVKEIEEKLPNNTLES